MIGASIWQLSASTDGSRLTLLNGPTHGRVYVAGFDAASGHIDQPWRLGQDDFNSVAYSWTHDSAAVLFNSDRNDAADILSQRLDRPTQEPVVANPGVQYRPESTADGHWILYVDTSSGATQLMRLPATGGTAEKLGTLSNYGFPRCALHGRCVVLERHGAELVVSDLDPTHGKGRELARCNSPLVGFSLTSEGNEAAFLLADRETIRIVSLNGGLSRDIRVQGIRGLTNLDPLPGLGGFLSSMYRTGHGRALVLVRPDGTWRILWAPTGVYPSSAIASPDGAHLAINAEVPYSNAWMVSGF